MADVDEAERALTLRLASDALRSMGGVMVFVADDALAVTGCGLGSDGMRLMIGEGGELGSVSTSTLMS